MPALPIALLLAAAIGLALLASWKRSADPGQQTIAILPLSGASGDVQNRFGTYLVQGVRDRLLSTAGARVLGEASSRRIAGAAASPPDLSRKFGIDLILETSIRSSESGHRVVARLIHASTGSELWSVPYSVDPAQLTHSRNRIVRDLAERVRESLVVPSRSSDLGRWHEGPAGERLAEATRLILLNRPSEALEARRILLDLVAAHPDNVPALAALAEATMAASDHAYVGGTIPTAQARDEARAYANRAIRLAPEAADGYAALGASHMETAQAIAPLTRAVALEPGNYLHHMRLGRALEFEDRYVEAYRHQLEATRLEPLAATPLINLIRALFQLGREQEIRHRLAAFAQGGAESADVGYVRGYYAFLRDDNVGCVRNFRALPLHQVSPQQRNVLLFCLSALGEHAASVRLVADEDSLRRDVLVGDIQLIEGRVRGLGSDFWRRHYESLAAAELLVNSGRHEVLLEQFDKTYNGVEEFIREGGFLTLYPQPLIVAMRRSGRPDEALRLRELLVQTVQSTSSRPGGDPWESYNGASIAMIDGQEARAIALLERCFAYCLFAVLQRDISETALFRPLTGTPAFDRLIRRYRVMINDQRKQLGLGPLPLV